MGDTKPPHIELESVTETLQWIRRTLTDAGFKGSTVQEQIVKLLYAAKHPLHAPKKEPDES